MITNSKGSPQSHILPLAPHSNSGTEPISKLEFSSILFCKLFPTVLVLVLIVVKILIDRFQTNLSTNYTQYPV